jgi:hypothetical protein
MKDNEPTFSRFVSLLYFLLLLKCHKMELDRN